MDSKLREPALMVAGWGLLYGDFFIDSNPSKSFMGTGSEYGSDEFKTWEEVLVYFKRLGGV